MTPSEVRKHLIQTESLDKIQFQNLSQKTEFKKEKTEQRNLNHFLIESQPLHTHNNLKHKILKQD